MFPNAPGSIDTLPQGESRPEPGHVVGKAFLNYIDFNLGFPLGSPTNLRGPQSDYFPFQCWPDSTEVWTAELICVGGGTGIKGLALDRSG